jgi:hypothetical protein
VIYGTKIDKSYDNKNNKELCSRLMDTTFFVALLWICRFLSVFYTLLLFRANLCKCIVYVFSSNFLFPSLSLSFGTDLHSSLCELDLINMSTFAAANTNTNPNKSYEVLILVLNVECRWQWHIWFGVYCQ